MRDEHAEAPLALSSGSTAHRRQVYSAKKQLQVWTAGGYCFAVLSLPCAALLARSKSQRFIPLLITRQVHRSGSFVKQSVFAAQRK